MGAEGGEGANLGGGDTVEKAWKGKGKKMRKKGGHEGEGARGGEGGQTQRSGGNDGGGVGGGGGVNGCSFLWRGGGPGHDIDSE